ncbi:MAG: orotate phosphoribosyltransferase [Bacteroidetes bacterium]|nr:orotate phosphoribosyltransferase [Bacteroidota bacterium]
MKLPKEQIIEIFKETKALLEGHFVLSSGLHSPQYFQCAKVLQYPKYLHLLAGEIARHFEYNDIEVVIAPAIGGITVATEVGRMLGARTLFSERVNGRMELRRGFEILPNERTLVVEDVITTGGSTNEVIELVKKSKGALVGVSCIVDRSNGKVRFDAKYFSVLQMDAVSYTPEQCPLCAEGSIPPSKPGSRGNY